MRRVVCQRQLSFIFYRMVSEIHYKMFKRAVQIDPSLEWGIETDAFLMATAERK